MSYLVLVLAVLFVLLGRSAVRRPRGSRPVWVTALVGSEMAGPLMIGSVILATGVIDRDWAGGLPGTMSAWGFVLAGCAFGLAFVRGLLTRPLFATATASITGRSSRIPIPLGALLAPVPVRRRGVVLTHHRYGPDERQVLDLEVGRRTEVPCPVLVHVHGGGWWRGRRHTQARPLRRLMARSGWAVVSPSYRLSPDATFPDHLVDVKRAIAWIRANAVELGLDPRFIAITGGSTGGNLAALAALTPGDAVLQPGFESADTTVQACVPLYGVHDLLRASGEPLWPYLVDSVMKVSPTDDPDSWRRASPVRLARSERPPFLVYHGASDTLVAPEQSRRLVIALQAVEGPPVEYLEIPWANHGFDFFAGPRGRMAAHAILQSLDHLRAERTAGQ